MSLADMPAVEQPTNEIVAAKIEAAILDHRLPPGTKLTEEELASIYQVSRGIVRSALHSLSHRDLVDIRRHRGAFVAQPTIREAREVFEARALLEPRTAHSAAHRARTRDIRNLERHIAREHEAMAAGELGRAVFLSGAFHIAIAEIADQTTVARFIASLIARSSLIVALYWRRRDALCESHAHHDLVDALREGDGARAEALMKSHLVDLSSSLDLGDRPAGPRSLREALG